MDIIALRCCALYGPGQVMPEYVRDVIKAAYSGESFTLPSGYDQKFNLVFVSDAAEASIRACFTETRSDFAAYNITSGYQPTLGEIMEVVKKEIPDAKFDVGPGVIEGWDQHGFFSIEAARKDLGYEPKVSFEEGMRKYIDWLRENGY
jgi:UDP-glucose 4-epimerase